MISQPIQVHINLHQSIHDTYCNFSNKFLFLYSKFHFHLVNLIHQSQLLLFLEHNHQKKKKVTKRIKKKNIFNKYGKLYRQKKFSNRLFRYNDNKHCAPFFLKNFLLKVEFYFFHLCIVSKL